MAKTWTEIEIEWDGETYSARPTLNLINALEQGIGHSMSNVLYRISIGDLPSGIACAYIGRTLRFAGCSVTDDEVYAETAGIGIDVINQVRDIIMACMPEPKAKPKEGADAKKKTAKTTSKRTSKRSTE